MTLRATEPTADPIEAIVQETEQLHEQVERLGDAIGLLSLHQELGDDLSELQGVYSKLSSSCEVVARASLKLTHQREDLAAGEEQAEAPLALAQPASIQGNTLQPTTELAGRRIDAKVALLQGELGKLISEHEQQQRRERLLVGSLKMASILFAALVVVVLGMRAGSPENELALHNLALILAVAILTISAYESFFDHRSIWFKRAATLTRLKNLRRDLVFTLSSESDAESEDAAIKSIKRRLDSILQGESSEEQR